MQQYHDALREILDNGIETTDRTGTGTIATFGMQMKFDLAKGFPLVTTKKLHLKSIIHELLWFVRGDTNNNSLKANNVSIWNEWSGKYGQLGPVYGSAWRYAPASDQNKMVEVPVRVDQDADFVEPEIVWLDKIECDLNTDDMWAVGVTTGKNSIYTVQTKSGFVRHISRPNWRALKLPEWFDGYARTVAGVGFLGNPEISDERLHTLWFNMISRCYNPDHPHYHLYGGAGVTVSPVWHSYERFQKTIASVPFFHLWEAGAPGVCLDKDYFGSRVYSPSTCIFIYQKMNTRLKNDTALEIKGVKYSCWAHFEEVSGLRSDYMSAQLRKGKKYKDYAPEDVRIIEPREGYVWRQQLFFDQIAHLIEQIRKTPDSRRLIVSAWHPADIEKMALPPCHTMWQVRILGGKLHLQLYQRSGDMFLGIPFNIASYSLLAHMLAHVTGYEVGTFVHTIGDAHIYSNHMDQVKEQLSREPRALPTLEIARHVDSIDDFRFEDFIIHGYDPHPAIKAPVAV